MVLTTAQQVRLKIQDQARIERKTYTADGITTGYGLQHVNTTTASAFVNLTGTWSATGATFQSGQVVFATPISANSAFLVSYTYSVFSDDEIDHLITAGGSVNGAALEAVTTLMFDSLKRAKWVAPDGTQFDDTMAMNQLNAMYDRLSNEGAQAAIQGGQITSWGENQA